jgi:hypothetical protein
MRYVEMTAEQRSSADLNHFAQCIVFCRMARNDYRSITRKPALSPHDPDFHRVDDRSQDDRGQRLCDRRSEAREAAWRETP